jgi:membrane associated rhomboid family serine protease
MSFFYWNVNRWRSCLQNVSYVFPENDGFQLWQPISYVYARWVYAHLFNMFALYSFGSALESFGEVKSFYSIFLVV